MSRLADYLRLTGSLRERNDLVRARLWPDAPESLHFPWPNTFPIMCEQHRPIVSDFERRPAFPVAASR